MRLVPVGALKEDTIVAKTIYNETGHVLLKKGVPLSKSFIDKLISNGVISVYIEDTYSTGEIKDVISPELRNKAVREVKQVFSSVQAQLRKQIQGLEKEKKNLGKKLKLLTDQKYFEQLKDVVEEMMIDLGNNREAMVGLVDIKSMNGYLYQHAVQVTVLSLIIGAELKLNAKSLKNLAIGAMLHDIGLAMIDPNLWVYHEDFSPEDKITYQTHPELGYQFIKDTANLPLMALIGILEHHENYNGTGYPLGREKDQIHAYGRIIAIADSYDKMTSGFEGKFIPPNEAIEYIMGNSGDDGRFDIDMATKFVRRVAPFPIGTYVKLSNGLTAVVIRYNVDHPLRPELKIIEQGKPLEQLMKLDLMSYKYLNLTILGNVY